MRRPCSPAPGATRPIFSSSAAPSAGLCGGFNAQIAKLAREHANKLLADGKTVKILTVGKKGNDILKRLYGRYIVDHVDLRSARTLQFSHAQMIADKVLDALRRGRVRRLHIVLRASSSRSSRKSRRPCA